MSSEPPPDLSLAAHAPPAGVREDAWVDPGVPLAGDWYDEPFYRLTWRRGAGRDCTLSYYPADGLLTLAVGHASPDAAGRLLVMRARAAAEVPLGPGGVPLADADVLRRVGMDGWLTLEAMWPRLRALWGLVPRPAAAAARPNPRGVKREVWPDTNKLLYWAWPMVVTRDDRPGWPREWIGVRMHVVDPTDPTRVSGKDRYRGWLLDLHTPATPDKALREPGAHLLWYMRQYYAAGAGAVGFMPAGLVPLSAGGFKAAIEYAPWRGGALEPPRLDAGAMRPEDLELLTEHFLPKAFAAYNAAQAEVVPQLAANAAREPRRTLIRPNPRRGETPFAPPVAVVRAGERGCVAVFAWDGRLGWWLLWNPEAGTLSFSSNPVSNVDRRGKTRLSIYGLGAERYRLTMRGGPEVLARAPGDAELRHLGMAGYTQLAQDGRFEPMRAELRAYLAARAPGRRTRRR